MATQTKRERLENQYKIEDPAKHAKAVIYSPIYSNGRLAIKVYKTLIGVGRVNAARYYRQELRTWKGIDRTGILALAAKYSVLIF